MSSGDSLVYDMSLASEAQPSVFVKRDWLNILDNQNGNYQGNQVVIDTSQLANSNKMMGYREAYLSVPLLMTATSGSATTSTPIMEPASAGTSADYAFGLKNWYGSIVHSITLDLAGTTIIQQTPLCGMWNTFTLMTTLSINDVITNGAQMGFYPDDPLAWSYHNGSSSSGTGVANNVNSQLIQKVSGVFGQLRRGNTGMRERQNYFVLDPDGAAGGSGQAFSALLTTSSMSQLYKSYIFNKINPDNASQVAVIQYAIQGIIQLKHLHNFFQQIPLLKGLFLRLTMNINQPTVVVTGGSGNMNLTSVTAPLGGVSPIMIASAANFSSGVDYRTTGTDSTGAAITATTSGTIPSGSSGALDLSSTDSVTVSLAVGNKVLNQSQSSLSGVQNSPLNQSIFLYVPAYTFNPTFEEAYIASPTKQIVYTDIYQFPTAPVASGSQFNFLITNGIANIKSILVIPFFTASGTSTVKPFQSPFDPAGAGPTSPLALISNFNVVVAGQNMIYNTQRYAFEQFMNQLQGCNAVNADLTDGLTSSLIDKLGFEQEYCYFYVNASRQLPVDESVPKSVAIQGTNLSTQEVSYTVFVEYGVQIGIDVLTGSRV